MVLVMFCVLVDIEVLTGSWLRILRHCLDFHPNMRRVVLTNISIEGWVGYICVWCPWSVKLTASIVYFLKPYMFFHPCDPLSIPFLAVLFGFLQMPIKFYCNSLTFHICNNIYSFTSMTTYWFLFGTHISFSLFMPVSFEIVCTSL